MSGGVDSSVAAALLLEQGYEVIGITMRLWTQEDPSAPRYQRRCCSVEDTDDARAAAETLGIRHYVLNMEREFAAEVVQPFVEEYARGRTPNPCLACNQRVKFRPLMAQATALGAHYLATGHYARIRRNGQGYELWRAADGAKDQSYVLYTLGQDELARVLFPVGDYQKPQVREIARQLELPNAEKPDSADICFIPSGDYPAFVAQRVGTRPGPIVDTAGRVIGQHEGIVGYTVGQRRRLPARGGQGPLYVIDVDAAANAVVAGPPERLLAEGLIAEDVCFVSGRAPNGQTPVLAQIRYRGAPVPASLVVRGGGTAEVRFQEPQRAVTPGQAVVFYDGPRVLGGGTIAQRL